MGFSYDNAVHGFVTYQNRIGNEYAASRFASSAVIQATGNFNTGGVLVQLGYFYTFGKFGNTTDAFVDLNFVIGDQFQLHAGWLRVDISDPYVHPSAVLTLKAYAYQTTPDKPIHTFIPEPGSLGLFALGAAGVAASKAQ